MKTPSEKVRRAYELIRQRGDDGVWLSLVPEDAALQRAAEIENDPHELPLRGLLFAVKDNIDVAGLPTTAACPEFSYHPEKHAFVVQKLLAAGAIVIGKTNLDQFATGLNGTRTPHTIPRNGLDAAYISGGSSSGSAVATSLGEVDFALGTDTAGSGRVPAAFNNLIGFKPTKGRWSTTGLVPACRSLDCITVFTKTLPLAALVDRIIAGFDAADPFSRTESPAIRPGRNCVAVLSENQREFFGDSDYARLYAEAIERVKSLGLAVVEFDYAPFLEAASLLYSGPWVAERLAALRDFFRDHADSVHPVVRQIIEGGEKFSAADTFAAAYRLKALERQTATVWETCDTMLLPTAGTIYTVDEMLAEPLKRNAHLGHYTNFVNLLDLCAVAIPAGFREDGLPFGVTFIGPAWTEDAQMQYAAKFLDEELTIVGGTGVKLAVVGAHLRGQPLNKQLVSLGARFVKQTYTAPRYRLYALPNTTPAKPGMVRVDEGVPIEVEVYELSETAFGRFVAAVPAPLGIGDVEMGCGKIVKGFLCESIAVRDAQDISSFGGWRAWLAASA